MSTFCRHLTNGLAYNNDSYTFTVSPCCYFSKNNYLDINKDLHQQLTVVRDQWQTSNLEKNCKLCIEAEQNNLHSYRQASFDLLDGLGNVIEFLTVAVNKKCNLACASCNAESSSFWYQENNRNGLRATESIQKIHAEDKQGSSTEKFLSLLRTQDLTNLKYIKFGGGEPLMVDTHATILSMVPNPENVTIHYTSNFSIMPSQSIFKLWEKFKLVKWVASVDGVGDRFSLLRWPYRWEKLEEFIIAAKESVPGNVMFGTEHTLNPLNVFYYSEFESWFQSQLGSNRYGDQSDLNIHLCQGILGLEHTPPGLRELVKLKYGPTHKVSQSLDQRPYSGNTDQLVQYLDQLDVWRNTNWRTTFLDIERLFDV